MKVCCISDLHGNIPELPDDIELLLIAGDICWHNSISSEKDWLDQKFNPWLTSLNVPVVLIGGNHDFYFEKFKSNDVGTYLENNYTEINGIKIFGTPLSLEVGDWVWQAKESDIAATLKGVKCDILLSHGPVHGYGDKVRRGDNIGSTAMKDYIIHNQPKLVINGHIHEARGLYQLGRTIIINCAATDLSCKLHGRVYCFEWINDTVGEISEWNSSTYQYRVF